MLLQNIHCEASSVPIVISEYQLSKVLPQEIESSLSSIEEIEKSLKAIAYKS